MPTTDELNTLLAHLFLCVLKEDAPWAAEVVEDCVNGDPHMYVDALAVYCENLTSNSPLSPLPTSGDME